MSSLTLERAESFCGRYGLTTPLLLAPMAGACPPGLSIAVANAGAMGALGALLTPPAGILDWVREFRSKSAGPFQVNLWIPDPAPRRHAQTEEQVRRFLAQWGPPAPPEAGDVVPPDFAAQSEALLEAAPTAVSSIMGVFPPAFVLRARQRGIAWFATATTLAEASIARDAGADAIVAQGYEAGGHRGVLRSLRRGEARRGTRSADPQARRSHRSADHRRRWHRRRTRRRGRVDPGRQRGHARNRLSARSRSRKRTPHGPTRSTVLSRKIPRSPEPSQAGSAAPSRPVSSRPLPRPALLLPRPTRCSAASPRP